MELLYSLLLLFIYKVLEKKLKLIVDMYQVIIIHNQ